MPHEHETNSLYELGKKAEQQPKLIKKEDIIRLAEHVLKERDNCSSMEIETAKEVLRNPEGAEAHSVALIGKKVAKLK